MGQQGSLTSPHAPENTVIGLDTRDKDMMKMQLEATLSAAFDYLLQRDDFLC